MLVVVLLKARHGVLGKRNCVNKSSVPWAGWGEEAVCSPIIRSQSFSEPELLGRDLRKCSSFPPLP